MTFSSFDNLSDEQKVILYKKFFKNHLFKTNKDLDIVVGSAVKQKTSLLEDVQSSIENLPTTQQNQARSLTQKIKKTSKFGYKSTL